MLETRYGTVEVARNIFQQGIWNCSQPSGGQSGGYSCARLWQAWGVLEAMEGDQAAARRCFSRALDADNRNVATITAWTLMEEDLGKTMDARSIFESKFFCFALKIIRKRYGSLTPFSCLFLGALKQFPPSSDEKMSLWRSYELMEQRLGNVREAQNVYQRSMRETFTYEDEVFQNDKVKSSAPEEMSKVLERSNEVEVERWGSEPLGGSLGGEVWMNGGSIEAKVPKSVLKKRPSKKLLDDSS